MIPAFFKAAVSPITYALEGRSPQWRKVRAQHLKDYPKCEACGGTDNLEVHHVKPFHMYPELELTPSNHITLCEQKGKLCHYFWGHLNLSWSTWNTHVRDDVKLWCERQAQAPGLEHPRK